MIIIYNNIIKQMEYLSILNSRFHLKYKKKKKMYNLQFLSCQFTNIITKLFCKRAILI